MTLTVSVAITLHKSKHVYLQYLSTGAYIS